MVRVQVLGVGFELTGRQTSEHASAYTEKGETLNGLVASILQECMLALGFDPYPCDLLEQPRGRGVVIVYVVLRAYLRPHGNASATFLR